MSNLQPLEWVEKSKDGFVEHTAQGAGIFYRIFRSNEDIKVIWVDSIGGSDGNKSFRFLNEAKHWIETDHYPHKMQPYVKPSPTWFNYQTEKPKQGDSIVILWVWMGDNHSIWVDSYNPYEIDYLDECMEVYWSFSPFSTMKNLHNATEVTDD